MEENKCFLLSNLINEAVNPYINKFVKDLKVEFNIVSKSKSINSMISKAIINCFKKKSELNEILNNNCLIKTVNLEWNNNLVESMSLNGFKYFDLYNQEWEESYLKRFFENTIFIFFVYKKEYKGDSLFKGIKIWKMPESLVCTEVKKVWLHTKNLIMNGDIINYIDSRGRYITNFLTLSNTKVIHVRPHASDFNDVYPLPVLDKVTGMKAFMKYSFWINKSFIKKVILEDKFYE